MPEYQPLLKTSEELGIIPVSLLSDLAQSSSTETQTGSSKMTVGYWLLSSSLKLSLV